MMASSAVPGIFPYQIIDGKIYVDGGTVNNKLILTLKVFN
jgi:predicted acylesterase/phospholipase RssA